MADPIKHNTASTVATGAAGALKGAAAGVGLFLGIGAAIGGGIALAAGASVLGALGIALGTAAALGVAGAVVGAPVFSVLAGGGALFGLAKASDKVSQENQRYSNRLTQKQHRHEVAVNDAGMQGMQQGYQSGFAEGQQAIMAQLRQMQEQQLMASAQGQQPEADKNAGHAARITKEREAGAAAAPQVG